jgi:hypothetical protein
MTERQASSAAFVLLAALSAGCVGYREYHDLAADRYPDALPTAGPTAPDARARLVVHVREFVRDELQLPVSRPRPEFRALARRTVEALALFKAEHIGRDVVRPDFFFIFNVDLRSTDKPVLVSGLILPFYRAREITARAQVLDAAGRPVTHAVASAQTFEVRHLFLLPATPFNWPPSAGRRARRSVFHALAVKLAARRDRLR